MAIWASDCAASAKMSRPAILDHVGLFATQIALDGFDIVPRSFPGMAGVSQIYPPLN